MLVRNALREYRTWIMDSRRWEHYVPRDGDIVVATYPKSGTTWTQRIVSLLIFQSPDPVPLSIISPWIERRFFAPVGAVADTLKKQTHRRAVKTHLPLDGMPIYDNIKYIHVARDGRDSCLSMHNHARGLNQAALDEYDRIGLEDETIGKAYPPIPVDPADYFSKWVSESMLAGNVDGYQQLSYFEMERSYWDERKRKNFLLVHYRDMKADLETEMRRIASFLNIDVPDETWPMLIKAASFETMKQEGDALMPHVRDMFLGGKDRFFNKGMNDRWKEVYRPADLAAYDVKVQTLLTPSCANWLAGGRAATSDPAVTLN